MTPLYRSREKFISLLIVLGALLTLGTFMPAAADSSEKWAAPNAVSVRIVSSIPHDGQGRMPYEDNLYCEKISRRLNGTNKSSIGCYGQTTYGSLDIRTNLMNFAGDSETAIHLQAHGPHDIFFPWPGTPSVLVLTPSPAGGVYLGIYRDVLKSSGEVRNPLGQVVARKISRPADLHLSYPDGSRLRANFNSIAFSENGAWLVVETMEGSFVRINLATLEIKSFARSFVGGGGRYDLSQLAVSNDGRHIAVANSGAGTLRVYDLSKCFSTAASSECKSADYWSAVKSEHSLFQYPVHLRFINKSLLSFIGIQNNTETSYLIGPSATISNLTSYIALGDSYTSGEGSYGYHTGTDTTTNSCRVSNFAYPALLTKSLFTPKGGNSVACSGAKIQDIVNNDGYRGQVSDGVSMKARSDSDINRTLSQFTPGNLPQVTFVGHYQPSVVTLSAGGNDIGFGNMLKLCVAPQFSRHLTAANDCYATYEDRVELANLIDSQEKRLVSLFKKVQLAAPATTVYVAGYPLIAVDTGSCALNVHLNTSEIALSIEVIKQLNAVIERSAKTANVSYIDLEEALAGHRLCETKSSFVAVHGVTAGTDGGVGGTVLNRDVSLNFLGKESFHPNVLGHELIAAAIKEQTSGLQLKKIPIATKPKAATKGSKILQAPKVNRPIKKKQTGSVSKKRSAVRGSQLPISVKGKMKGLRPISSYSVILKDGPNKSNLGNVVTDSESNIEGALIPLPIIEPGNYEIDIIGEDQLGEETIISDVITIIESETDYDGDGITNEVDSCITIFNAGVDDDKDGIDDVCDSIVSEPPAASSGQKTQTPPPPADMPKISEKTSYREAPTGSRLSVGPARSGSEVLGVSQTSPSTINSVYTSSAKPTYDIQPASKIQAAEKGSPQKWYTTTYGYKELWRIPWIQMLILMITGMITVKVLKRVGNNWRRKRDSNPRYP